MFSFETSTHSPFRLVSTAERLPRSAACFGLGALLIRDLSITEPSSAKNFPTDLCHPSFSTQSAPVLSTLEDSYELASDLFEERVGSRRRRPLRRGPLDCQRALRSLASWRPSPLTSLSWSPLLTSALQPSDTCRTHQGNFHPRHRDTTRVFVAGDAFHRSRFERLLLLAFGRGSEEILSNHFVSNLDVRGGYASSNIDDFPSPTLARALPEGSARGVPARASPCPRFPEAPQGRLRGTHRGDRSLIDRFLPYR